MKLIEIKPNINWGFWILGKPVFVIKKYYGMMADQIDIDPDGSLQEGFEIVSMDHHYAQLCDGINGYKIAGCYESEKANGFKGSVIVSGGDKIVGFACGSTTLSYAWKYSDFSQSCFYVKYVYVDPKYRGRHYARILLHHLYESSNENCFCLMVREKNQGAIKAYESVGFRILFLRKFVVFPLIHKTLFYRYKKYNDHFQ